MELNFEDMAIAGENRFTGMVEWDIGSVILQWPWLCHWWLPSIRGQEWISWLPFDGIEEIWRWNVLYQGIGFEVVTCRKFGPDLGDEILP